MSKMRLCTFIRRKMIYMTIILLFATGVQTIAVQAESYLDPAPVIQREHSNGKRVLFDNTHAQTAGAADWVIDGGFSDYANALADEGYYVTELRKNTPITYSDLSSYDVFVIPEANVPYKVTEQSAILEYVESGGSVFFIADHYNADRNKNRWDSAEVFNGYRRGAYADPAKGMSAAEASSDAMAGVVSSDWLAENFGVRFRYNALGDINTSNIVNPADCFGITENVNSVAMHAGGTLAILDPSIAKGIVYMPGNLTSANKWGNSVDAGVYNGGGIPEGAYVAISKVGEGKAAFIGDSSPVEDATPKYRNEENGGTKRTYDGFKEADDAELLTQLIDWLAVEESYTSFNGLIPLDTATVLHGYETPSLSTEPQSEPWNTPSVSYKWYDAGTFAAGSYGSAGGSGGGDIHSATFTFTMPQSIVAGQQQQMTLTVSGLAPNTTYTGLQMGAYVTGGTQIGKFAGAGENLPANYGYSAAFSVTSDAGGQAVKVLDYLLNPSASGEFSLRLRQNSANLFTQTHTIGGSGTIDPPPSGVAAYSTDVPSDIAYGIVTPVTIKITGLAANQSITTLQAGSYLNGGLQIGLFSLDGINWSTANGYSGNFTMTADASGTAVKTIWMKLNTTSTGSAFFRIRNGSTNMLTTPVTVETPPPIGSVTYGAYLPATIASGVVTPVTINITGLAANQSITTLQAGSYLNGGLQIGLFSLDGTNWSTTNGYSGNFTMTADANGIAARIIWMKLNTTSTGSAFFRIRDGSTNKLTIPITVE